MSLPQLRSINPFETRNLCLRLQQNDLGQAGISHAQLCSQRRRLPKHHRRTTLLFGSKSNLGELERFAGTDPGLSSFEYQPMVTNYVPEARFDGPVATVSILLILILTAIAFDRILGLDILFNKAMLKWKEKRAYERRNETIKARERLEAAFSDEDEDEEGRESR
ncbi:hypothetical protein Ndes2526B_g04758 [Nannochloris sp. 'desiccata']